MAGWNLRKGYYEYSTLSENDIWQMFNNIFSYKSKKVTTYKFVFLKVLFENCDEANEEGEIDLKIIFRKFAKVYWGLVVKNNLNQGDNGVTGGKPVIESIFKKYIMENPESATLDYDEINYEIKDFLEKEVLEHCKQNVVGAIYEDSNKSIYSFVLKDNYLKLNPSILNFIRKYQRILLNLNEYSWVKFLLKTNSQLKGIDIIKMIENS